VKQAVSSSKKHKYPETRFHVMKCPLALDVWLPQIAVESSGRRLLLSREKKR
jgi:hypothetical protein